MRKFFKFILTIFIVCFTIFFSVSTVLVVSAEDLGETAYTDVLTDLQKDPSFNVSNYPMISNTLDENYGSISVIQIAESVDKEVFIYVYQPAPESAGIRACSINISRTVDSDLNYSNFRLELINFNGVFYKYRVKNMTAYNDSTRYYLISSIYRPFNVTIDSQLSNDNKLTEIAFTVDKKYQFKDEEDGVEVSCVENETIAVPEKFVGYVSYPNGYLTMRSWCHSHFVAFCTDKPIDKLLEAKVYYTSQSYILQTNYTTFTALAKYGEVKETELFLKYDDKATFESGGLLGGATYTWDRIQSVDEFKNNVIKDSVDVYSGALLDVQLYGKLTDETLEELDKMQWVLRFVETEHSVSRLSNVDTEYDTLIGNVTILQLTFETDGIVYRLGVIDNKQTGSHDPINSWQINIQAKDWGKIFIALLLLIGFIVIFMPILTPILSTLFGFIVKVFAVIIEIIFNILTFPLRLINKLTNKRKNR